MAKQSETRDFLWFLAKLAVFVFILRSFIISPFNIPSESMQPRLLIGDYLLVAKWPYGYSRYSLPFSLPLIPGRILASTPERGDVVVFKAPPTQKSDYIKRVIGLPGDLISVQHGTVILNGQAIPKQKIADLVLPVSQNMIDKSAQDGNPSPCYRAKFEETDKSGVRNCRYPQYRETLPNGKSYNVLDLDEDGAADNRDTVVVPEGRLFLMGDNRDRSADSRFPAEENAGIGLVPEENLVGKALVSVFSTDGSSSWFLPWTWFTAARWNRIGEGFLSRSGMGTWIEELIERAPGKPELFAQALTHGSASGSDYQRLEFLGDRVLGVVMAEWLFLLFPTEPEGSLSRRFNALVSGETCAEVARSIHVQPHLVLGKQARDDGAADSDNVLGDVMEAIIGALFLDGGLDEARALIKRLWSDRVHTQNSAPRHPKSALQEWAAANRRKPPEYVMTGKTGPHHALRFTVTVSIKGAGEASAEGGSKQEAETAAAKALLEKLS